MSALSKQVFRHGGDLYYSAKNHLDDNNLYSPRPVFMAQDGAMWEIPKPEFKAPDTQLANLALTSLNRILPKSMHHNLVTAYQVRSRQQAVTLRTGRQLPIYQFGVFNSPFVDEGEYRSVAFNPDSKIYDHDNILDLMKNFLSCKPDSLVDAANTRSYETMWQNYALLKNVVRSLANANNKKFDGTTYAFPLADKNLLAISARHSPRTASKPPSEELSASLWNFSPDIRNGHGEVVLACEGIRRTTSARIMAHEKSYDALKPYNFPERRRYLTEDQETTFLETLNELPINDRGAYVTVGPSLNLSLIGKSLATHQSDVPIDIRQLGLYEY